jgi:hypothetical protein
MPILYPYKMSDWYGYCKVCTSPVTSFSSSIIQTSSTVCSATINQTYYHDGSASLPVVNDIVYSNVAGSNLLAAGSYRISSTNYLVVNASGVVTSIGSCVTLKPYSSSTMSVFNGACPFNGSNPGLSQTYYHNGSGTLPAQGDNCYSDSSGNNVLLGGYYNINSATGQGNRLYIFISSNTTGEVDLGYPQYC